MFNLHKISARQRSKLKWLNLHSRQCSDVSIAISVAIIVTLTIHAWTVEGKRVLMSWCPVSQQFVLTCPFRCNRAHRSHCPSDCWTASCPACWPLSHEHPSDSTYRVAAARRPSNAVALCGGFYATNPFRKRLPTHACARPSSHMAVICCPSTLRRIPAAICSGRIAVDSCSASNSLYLQK